MDAAPAIKAQFAFKPSRNTSMGEAQSCSCKQNELSANNFGRTHRETSKWDNITTSDVWNKKRSTTYFNFIKIINRFSNWIFIRIFYVFQKCRPHFATVTNVLTRTEFFATLWRLQKENRFGSFRGKLIYTKNPRIFFLFTKLAIILKCQE